MTKTGPTLATIALIRDRDNHQCVACGRGGALTTQHRVSRGMGGSRNRPWINRPSNLISLCGSGTTGCHGWVEHHPHEAKARGWALSRYTEHPEDHPVLYPDGGYYFLSDDGGKHALGRFPSGSTGRWGGPLDDPHLGVAVPEGHASARALESPFPV